MYAIRQEGAEEIVCEDDASLLALVKSLAAEKATFEVHPTEVFFELDCDGPYGSLYDDEVEVGGHAVRLAKDGIEFTIRTVQMSRASYDALEDYTLEEFKTDCGGDCGCSESRGGYSGDGHDDDDDGCP